MTNKKYNIVFVLPGIAPGINGGYKMVYEYANRLAQDGLNVIIYYDNSHILSRYKVPEFVKNFARNYFTHKGPKWFNLDQRVRNISSKQIISSSFFEQTDIAVATAASTVKVVSDKFPSARKVYFIQDYEADSTGQSWESSERYVRSTYKAGFVNIVVSKWLKDIVDSVSGKSSIYIRNPIDLSKYRPINAIESRNPLIIGMLYHESPRKGCEYTWDAITLVKEKYPQLSVQMFGACSPPKTMPEWVEYLQDATQEETISLYNSVGIFASGPIKEGFGLTSLEAMACGAALITSDNLGAHEYASQGVNALFSPVKDSVAMARNIEYLINHNSKRIEIARLGVEVAKKYSWTNAYRHFKSALIGNS